MLSPSSVVERFTTVSRHPIALGVDYERQEDVHRTSVLIVRRAVLIIASLALLSGCSHIAAFDSCSRTRDYKQFDWSSSLFHSLPTVDVATLPPQVPEAVEAYLRKMDVDAAFEIVAARSSGDYLLVTVRPPCFDCDRSMVYSKSKQCVVGGFQGPTQG